MVTQYDVEQFQKIERAIGLKMKVFPTEEEMVLVMLDRVSEAQRIAVKEMKEMKETGGTGKRAREADGDSTRPQKRFKGKGRNKRR